MRTIHRARAAVAAALLLLAAACASPTAPEAPSAAPRVRANVAPPPVAPPADTASRGGWTNPNG